jgi:hypothetical protein
MVRARAMRMRAHPTGVVVATMDAMMAPRPNPALQALLLSSLFLLSGCRVIGDIFKAGVWVGVLIVVGVVAIVGGAFAMLGRR